MPICMDPDCGSTKVKILDGQSAMVCAECGGVLAGPILDDEVAFGETSGGAAFVTGSMLSNSATGFNGFAGGRYGGNRASSEMTEQAGISRCLNLSAEIGLGATIGNKAGRIWVLAYQKGFTRGRRSELVVGACLYAACRREIVPPPIMLIDLSERLNGVNVFEIGAVYLKLIHEIESIKDHRPLDPSIYIHRFCALLEFGDETRKVETDAVKLVARFKRDWISEGRRPSGICGACIILAARMNNFRRTVNEVVQVVKIADVTIKKRLEEFTKTKAGTLNAGTFLQDWLGEGEGTESTELPPAMIKNHLKEAKAANEKEMAARRRRDQSVQTIASDETGEAEEDLTPTGRKRKNAAAQGRAGKKKQKDKNGTARATEEENEPSNEAGPSTPRASTSTAAEASANSPSQTAAEPLQDVPPGADPIYGEDGIIVQEAISQTIDDALEEGGFSSDLQRLEERQRRKRVAFEQSMAEMPDDPLKGLDEDELDDEILTNDEARIKEHIWIQNNWDYLEKLQEKLKKRKLDDLQPQSDEPRRKKQAAKNIFEPGASAAASSEAGFRRAAGAKLSRNINYALLENLFKTTAEDSDRDETPLREIGEMEKTDEKGDEDGQGEEDETDAADKTDAPAVEEELESEEEDEREEFVPDYD